MLDIASKGVVSTMVPAPAVTATHSTDTQDSIRRTDEVVAGIVGVGYDFSRHLPHVPAGFKRCLEQREVDARPVLRGRL